MFSRAPLVKPVPVAKAAAPAKQAPGYFSTQEATEAGAPEYSYSLAGIRMFARGEDEAGWRQPKRLPLQAKLKVGAVNDPLEREADRVAELVTRMPDRKATPATVSNASRSLQRKCACGGSCGKCKAQGDEQQALQMKSAG